MLECGHPVPQIKNPPKPEDLVGRMITCCDVCAAIPHSRTNPEAMAEIRARRVERNREKRAAGPDVMSPRLRALLNGHMPELDTETAESRPTVGGSQ